MTTKKPSETEDKYFAKEEAEKRYRIQQQQHRLEDEEEKSRQKELHYMKCPKCGDNLKTISHHLVEIDECPNCGTIVLEPTQLEKLIKDETSIFKSFIDVFRKDA